MTLVISNTITISITGLMGKTATIAMTTPMAMMVIEASKSFDRPL